MSLLSLHDAGVWLGGKEILKDISFGLEAGETVGLIGPGASGKSVLLKTIAGLLPLETGSIDKPEQKDIGISFQEQALFDSMTVHENVRFAVRDYDDANELATAMLEKVGLGAALGKLPGEISGGMKRRVALARAFVTKPRLLLLDDPIAGLDPVSATRVLELVAGLSADYSPAILIASHDLRRLFASVERVIALDNQRIQMDIPVSDLSTKTPSFLAPFIRARYG